MIREWLTYLRTRSSPAARKLGYVHEAIAIRERHSRNRSAWEPHLKKCRETVLRAAEQCEDTKSCIILGSGLLLDVPLTELAAKFDTVHLVDIVHLPEIRRRIEKLDGVNLIESDLTGLTKQWRVDPAAFREQLPSPRPPKDLRELKADLVVSLNLLSQLPLNLIAAVTADENPTNSAIEEWRQEIQQSHWGWIQSLATTACVISDINHTRRTRDGSLAETNNLCALPQTPAPTDTWTWDLASRGELAHGQTITAEVCAWTIADRKPQS